MAASQAWLPPSNRASALASRALSSTQRSWDGMSRSQHQSLLRLGTPVVPAPTTTVERPLSSSSWEGAWNLRFEFQGNWSKRPLNIEATQSGVTGDYGLGTLEGRFGKETSLQSTAQSRTRRTPAQPVGRANRRARFRSLWQRIGRSMAGWWDVCSEGHKWAWEADRR